MEVLVKYQFRPPKKEPFAVLLRRLHDELAKASPPVSYEFSFVDSQAPGGVSAVDRAVKKFPLLAALVESLPQPGMPEPIKSINGGDSDLPFTILAEVTDGLPRSLPFDSAGVRLSSPAFARPFGLNQDGLAAVSTGIVASDNWWVNGRKRILAAAFVLEAGESARALPAPSGALGAFLATLGKPSKTSVSPLMQAASLGTLAEISKKYRGRLAELVADAGMPHSLPAWEEALATSIASRHPLKPALDRHFNPLGYSCVGGHGSFTLRRRTSANHVVEVYLDVGTWSRKVMAFFRVHVPGDHFTLRMPVAPGLEAAGQYPIGGTERWELIVANLAAFAAYLDRRVVPEIDAAAGPAPEWFDPPA